MIKLDFFKINMLVEWPVLDLIKLLTVHSREEWFSNTGTMRSIKSIFMSPIPKIQQIFFLLQIKGTLKKIYFRKICKYLPNTSKNNRQIKNSKLKIFQNFFGPPKWASWFLAWSKKKKMLLLTFSLFLASINPREDWRRLNKCL